jgi:hypothetical protein
LFKVTEEATPVTVLNEIAAGILSSTSVSSSNSTILISLATSIEAVNLAPLTADVSFVSALTIRSNC